MNDILPHETPVWRYVEDKLRVLLNNYGYDELRTPIAEFTQLFARSIGDNTDVVEKEMYTFSDRNSESLTLRPEATAGCVRAGIQHGLLFNQVRRMWLSGPMFRYEKPQKGRYRQFYQFSVETFGMQGPDIDVELIFLATDFWRELGLSEHVNLEINTLGSTQARLKFRDDLVVYLSKYTSELDPDSRRRLTSNPLRIFDSKDKNTQKILEDAPRLHDYLDEESIEHFEIIKNILDKQSIKYKVNQGLVRGLDYYNRTVFEWVTDSLGAQSTVCGGGRYDGLVEQLGGKSTPACGFALGVERIVLLLEKLSLVPVNVGRHIDIIVLVLGDVLLYATSVIEWLRRDKMSPVVILNCNGGSIKNQLKKADKSGARFAAIIGVDEEQKDRVTLKNLRSGGESVICTLAEVIKHISDAKK